MKGRVNVPEKYAPLQCVVSLAPPDSGQEGFLRACDTAPDQGQETARVNRSAAQQRDGCAFHHEIAGQDSGGNSVEFQ